MPPSPLTTIEVFTLLNVGFSIFAAGILLIAYLLFLDNMQKSVAGKVACSLLLIALAGLQSFHLAHLLFGVDGLFSYRVYVLLLLTAPPAFYFFSRELLLPNLAWSGIQLLHVLPMSLAFFLPFEIVVPAALAIGAGYSIWFARAVYGLRRHVQRFRFEMFFFGLFALIAVLVLVLFLLVPYVDDAVFYIAYANFTGLALFLIVGALIVFPEMLEDITDVARIAYAKSTLNDVDIDAKLAELEQSMSAGRLYQNEDLTLRLAAEAIGLSGHQLSELVNTHFGKSFSRYVRGRRIAEAKRLLRADNKASILSISLETGFRSQSNFYAAFKEETGLSPGQFRRAPE